MKISPRCSLLPDLDQRSPKEIADYDHFGVPEQSLFTRRPRRRSSQRNRSRDICESRCAGSEASPKRIHDVGDGGLKTQE